MNDLQEGRGIGENAGAKKAVRAAAILQRHHSRISEINIKGQVKGVIRERFLKGRTDVFKDRPAVFQVEIKNDIQSTHPLVQSARVVYSAVSGICLLMSMSCRAFWTFTE